MEDYLLRHVTVRRRLGYMCKAAKAPYIRAKPVHIHIPMADSVPESDVEPIVIDIGVLTATVPILLFADYTL